MYHFVQHRPTIRNKLKKDLIASRPTAYVIIICTSALAALAYKLFIYTHAT